jgi:hypothetical protein
MSAGGVYVYTYIYIYINCYYSSLGPTTCEIDQARQPTDRPRAAPSPSRQPTTPRARAQPAHEADGPNRTDRINATKENRECRWLRKEGPPRAPLAISLINHKTNGSDGRIQWNKELFNAAHQPTPCTHCTFTSESKESGLTDRRQLTRQHIKNQ